MNRLEWVVGVVLVFACAVGCETGTDLTVPDATLDVDTGVVDSGVVTPMDSSTGLPAPTIDTCTAESMGSTIGTSCTTNDMCDDGCFCNGRERCGSDGTCEAGADPCADELDCTVEACLEEADRCAVDPMHSMCADGDLCNGVESCDLRLGCISGSPLYCNDENSCTVDSCDPSMGCLFTARDLDGDGYTDGACGGEDCDDDPRYGRNIYPGAPEVCDNRRDDDCDGARDFNDSDCVPINDTCVAAILLPGAGTYSGSTRTLTDDYTLSCGSRGPDSVYQFTLAEMQDVTIQVGGSGSGTSVALRPLATCADGPDDKCATGSSPTLLRRSLPAGDYAIIISTPTPGTAFDLVLRFDPPTPIPLVDQCNDMTVDVSAGGMFTGMFIEVEDDYSLSCHRSTTRSYRDAAYRFTIASPKDVTITGSTTGGSWTPTTYLALTTDCTAEASELACRSSSSAELRQRELPAGTYYILVESSADPPENWTLNVSITDPVPRNPGDSCSTATDITTASASVDLSMLELDTGTSCGGTSSSYRDANFYFDLADTQDVTVTTNAAGSFHYTAVQATCGVSTGELGCRSGSGDNSQTWRSLPAGRYYVTSSTSRSSGTLTASVSIRPPTAIPANDRCSGAITLANADSYNHTTIGFADDGRGGSCAGTSRPDAFYSFVLTERKSVILTVRDGDSGSTRFYLTLRRDVCGGSSSSSLACESDTGMATINQVLDPGTYYLMVETTSSDPSDYNISSFFLAP